MTSCVLQDAFGGVMINVDMLSQSGLILDNPAFTTLKLFVTPSETGLSTIFGGSDPLDAYFVGAPTFGEAPLAKIVFCF